MKIRSELKLFDNQDNYETIAMIADSLIDKIVKNKLRKEDRMYLESAVAIIHELRTNQE